MHLDYRGGILFIVGAIAGHYIDSALGIVDPFLIQIINLKVIDVVFIIIGSIGALIIAYDKLIKPRKKEKASFTKKMKPRCQTSGPKLSKKTSLC
jgi:hypothetical protein